MVNAKRDRVIVFVEGGGDNDALKIECRRAFHQLFEKAGLGRQPRVVVCGSRSNAFDQFATACRGVHKDQARPLLLVDSEAPVTHASPWVHVRARPGDGWERPPGASDDDLHFMVECMEAWLVADRAALREFFGPELHEKALPARPNVEAVAKIELYRALENATRPCVKKGRYGKGSHSFKLLALVQPEALRDPWARRFFAELERRLAP